MDKQTTDRLGYDSEEFYFDRLNRELTEKLREKLDRERKIAEGLHSETDYWMRCPKCGNCLIEVSGLSLKVDRCVSCKGIYFDAGELSLLLSANDPGLIAVLKESVQEEPAEKRPMLW